MHQRLGLLNGLQVANCKQFKDVVQRLLPRRCGFSRDCGWFCWFCWFWGKKCQMKLSNALF